MIVCNHCERSVEQCLCNGNPVQKSTKARTVAQVLKVIGCTKLDLVKGSGYLYFVYDDKPRNIYETESVYVCYLNHLSVENWSEIGKEFVKRVTA